MAELDRRQFAALCGTTDSIIRVNCNRNKLVDYKKKVNGKEVWYLDTENPKNKAFFKKYSKKAQARIIKPKQKAIETEEELERLFTNVVEPSAKKGTRKKAEPKKLTQKEIEQHAQEKLEASFTFRKLKAEALLKERQAEKKEVNVMKLSGKLIPFDLAFNIIRIHNQEIFATFHNDVENLASIFCDILAAGDRKKLSEITSKLSEKLDDSVKRAADVAMQSIEQAVEDYADTRSRGEKK